MSVGILDRYRVASVLKTFDESKHPRKGGKFAAKGSSTESAPDKVPTHLHSTAVAHAPRITKPKLAADLHGAVPTVGGQPVKPKKFIGYHVTEATNVEGILKNGFDLSKVKPRWQNDNAVSLATGSAKNAAGWFTGPGKPFDGKKYVVLRVEGTARYSGPDDVNLPPGIAKNPKEYTKLVTEGGWDAMKGGSTMYVYNPQSIGHISVVLHDELSKAGVAITKSIGAIMKSAAAPVADAPAGENCGTGHGGFKPGNKCGGKKKSKYAFTGASALKQTKLVDTSSWKEGHQSAEGYSKKIAVLDQMHDAGDWDELSQFVPPNPGNSYQKAVGVAWKKAVQQLGTKLGKTPDEINAALSGASAKPAIVTPQTAKPVLSIEDKVPQKKSVDTKSFAAGDVSGWKKTGDKLGTAPGGIFEDKDGKKFYVKSHENPEQAAGEVLAARLYEMAGAPILDYHAVTGSKGEITGTATPWEQADKANWKDPDQLKNASAFFAVHAWLNNRDAIGAGSENPMDNQRWVNGHLTTMDAGGALMFGGLGGKKEFEADASEWDTLRDPKKNPTCAKVFGHMTGDQLYASAQMLKNIQPADVEGLVDKFAAGGLAGHDKQNIVDTLLARRDAILSKAEQFNPKKKPAENPMPETDVADSPQYNQVQQALLGVGVTDAKALKKYIDVAMNHPTMSPGETLVTMGEMISEDKSVDPKLGANLIKAGNKLLGKGDASVSVNASSESTPKANVDEMTSTQKFEHYGDALKAIPGYDEAWADAIAESMSTSDDPKGWLNSKIDEFTAEGEPDVAANYVKAKELFYPDRSSGSGAVSEIPHSAKADFEPDELSHMVADAAVDSEASTRDISNAEDFMKSTLFSGKFDNPIEATQDKIEQLGDTEENAVMVAILTDVLGKMKEKVASKQPKSTPQPVSSLSQKFSDESIKGVLGGGGFSEQSIAAHLENAKGYKDGPAAYFYSGAKGAEDSAKDNGVGDDPGVAKYVKALKIAGHTASAHASATGLPEPSTSDVEKAMLGAGIHPDDSVMVAGLAKEWAAGGDPVKSMNSLAETMVAGEAKKMKAAAAALSQSTNKAKEEYVTHLVVKHGGYGGPSGVSIAKDAIKSGDPAKHFSDLAKQHSGTGTGDQFQAMADAISPHPKTSQDASTPKSSGVKPPAIDHDAVISALDEQGINYDSGLDSDHVAEIMGSGDPIGHIKMMASYAEPDHAEALNAAAETLSKKMGGGASASEQTSTPPSMPVPPAVGWGSSPVALQAKNKLAALYNAAAHGGLDALEKVKLSFHKNSYGKAIYAYKAQLVEALSKGAKPTIDSVHVTKNSEVVVDQMKSEYGLPTVEEYKPVHQTPTAKVSAAKIGEIMAQAGFQKNGYFISEVTGASDPQAKFQQLMSTVGATHKKLFEKANEKVGGVKAKAEEAKKIKPLSGSTLPSPPEFQTSNPVQKASNESALNALKDVATGVYDTNKYADVVQALQDVPPHPSPKVNAYKQTLISAIESEHAGVPVTSTSSGYEDADKYGKSVSGEISAAKPLNAAALKEQHLPSVVSVNSHTGAKIAKYLVLGSPKYDPGMPAVVHASQDKLDEQTLKAFESVPSSVKDSIHSYTNSAYGTINNNFRNGAASASQKAVATHFTKAAIPLPTGTYLMRGVSLEDPHLMMSAQGKVISEPGYTSTALNGSGFSGNIQWHITTAPGARAMSVHAISGHKSEKEMLFPPNQRYFVHKVIQSGTTYKVFATALPTPPDQCCGA